MDKFKSPLFNKFKDFEKNSDNAGWESFKSKKLEGSALSNKFKDFEKDSATAGWEAFTNKNPAITALSQKFEGYEKVTTGAGYQQYEKKKKRKEAIVFWFLKVPLILGMLVFAFYANLKRENPIFDTIRNEEIANKVIITKDSESSKLTKDTDKEGVLSNEKDISINENNSQNIERFNQSNKSNSISSTLSNQEIADQGVLGKENTSLNNGIFLANKNTDQNIDFISDAEKGDIKNDQNLNIRPLFNENWEKLSLNKAEMSYMDVLLDQPFERVDFDPDFRYKKPSLWSIYFKTGANITSSKIIEQKGATEYANRYYKELTEKAETPAIGYEFQLGAEYKYLRQFSFKTGIGFSKHRIGGVYNHQQDSIPLVDIDGTIYYLPPNRGDSSIIEGKAGYSYSYLNIPLGIVKTYPINDKWEAIGDVSMELSVLMGANGTKLNEVYINKFEKFDVNNLQKVNANLNLGLGIMRKVNKDLSIGVIATGKTYLSPINTNGYFRSKNTNIGLSFIIRNNL